MHLEELINKNKKKFKESTIFEVIKTKRVCFNTNNNFTINFNNKLKIRLTLYQYYKEIAFEILEQDERYWNKNEKLSLLFITHNNWEIRSNSLLSLNLKSKTICLEGYLKRSYDDECKYEYKYQNQKQIIDMLLALQEWSLNCPYFNENGI